MDIFFKTAAHRQNRALLPLVVAVTLALGYILLPFFGAILWGVIMALLFAPLNRWLLPRVRHQPNTAAMLTLLIVLFVVVLPAALVAASLVREAALVFQRIQSGDLDPTRYFQGVFNALPSWVASLLEYIGLGSFSTVLRRLTSALTQGTQFIAEQTFTIGQNTFDFVASLFITLYLAFFLIRDGREVVQTVGHAIPLAAIHKQALLQKFVTVIRATVKGNLLIAAIQGALGGLAFGYLGVSGALLWAVLMGFLSLVPAVGAALVWLPVAVYFFIAGEILKSLALLAYGVLVIGLVDNLLRPFLVGKDTRLPDYIVMITTLGGMAVFGINGFVLGPVIAAMFFAVWHIHVSVQSRTDEPVSNPPAECASAPTAPCQTLK